MKAIEKRIAARLLSMGSITEHDLEAALAEHDGRIPLTQFLVARRAITAREACRAEAEVNGLHFIDLEEAFAVPEAIALMTREHAWQHQLLPLWFEKDTLVVAMADASNVFLLDDLRYKLRKPVVGHVAEKDDLARALSRYYGPHTSDRVRASREVFARAAVGGESGAEMDETQDAPSPDSSGEVSHREFQRRAREAHESEDISLHSLETVFLESSASTLRDVESDRQRRGAYEPPPDVSRLEKVLKDAANPAVQMLRRLLEEALQSKVQELELTPKDQNNVRVRCRAFGGWETVPGYAIKHHETIMASLRMMAGLELHPQELSQEHQFLLPVDENKTMLCTLYLEPTPLGERAVIRFSENVPLLGTPLVNVGLPKETAEEVNARLCGSGGGLFFLSATNSRSLQHLYQSIIAHLAKTETRDIISLERPNERQIPGVTSINCPNDEVLLASLANAAFMNPDVLGVASVENGSVMNRVINLAIRGTTTVACFTAPNSRVAQRCFQAAKVDPMNIMRGVIGHLHVEEAKKLCVHCSKPIEDVSTLPDWTAALEAEFQEAVGCEQCRKSGFQGTVYLMEYFAPDMEKADGGFTTVIERSRDLLGYSIAGEIDPRDYKL